MNIPRIRQTTSQGACKDEAVLLILPSPPSLGEGSRTTLWAAADRCTACVQAEVSLIVTCITPQETHPPLPRTFFENTYSLLEASQPRHPPPAPPPHAAQNRSSTSIRDISGAR
eukprot:scaffold147_cov169-Pinguiococcus_pyrenoidosus.AAC.4